MRRLRPALLLLALLAGCPEERPDTRLQVPAARVPPAVPVEAGAATVPAASGAPGVTSGR